MHMPKFVSAAPRGQGRRRPTELPDDIDGQIAEICRDLAVQVKRMRQLQEQADELRVVIRQWASPLEPTSVRKPASREGRR
jgi:hypothetical protein